MMIPDRCCIGPARQPAPHPCSGISHSRPPRCGLGQVAADCILHAQRFALPLGLFSLAQPRLGRRPPSTAVLAGEHYPPPPLDDVTERPQIPGQPGRIQRLIQVLLEPSAVGVGRTARTSSTRSGRPGPVAQSATLTPHLLAGQTGRPLLSCDRACSGDPACSLGHRSASLARTASRVAGRRPPRRRRFRRNTPTPSSAR